jgi:hypothetical protein
MASVQLQFDPPCNDDEYQHVMVFVEAFDLFRERSAFRGDMWRQFPPSDKIRELRERVSRIEMAVNMSHIVPQGRNAEGHMEAMKREIRSDAIDIINYATFLVKQIDEGFDL